MISGGAGEFRGGLGQLKEYEILDDLDGALSFSHRGERHVVAASGMAGGGDGAKARSVIYRRDGAAVEIPSKMVTELEPGDRVVIETAGGGGWGPPGRRSREALAEDIANGKVSAEEEHRVYEGE